jgi:hypothetical protein
VTDAEMGPHEVWCDTQNAISHRCNCMASTYIDKIEDMQKRIDELSPVHTCHDKCRYKGCVQRRRIEKLETALMTVLNQPFNGSWDAQAVFIQEALEAMEGKET